MVGEVALVEFYLAKGSVQADCFDTQKVDHKTSINKYTIDISRPVPQTKHESLPQILSQPSSLGSSSEARHTFQTHTKSSSLHSFVV